MKEITKNLKIYIKTGRKNWHVSILIILCLVIMLSHSLYVLKTQQYPKMDEHSYMELSVAFYRIMQNQILSAPQNIMQYLIDHPPFRQPLYPLILSFTFLLTGVDNSYKIALLLNGIFYITIIIAIYYLGKEFLSKTSSVIASIIFAFYGFPLFYLHFTYSETATTAFILLTLCFLVRSKNFLSRKYSFLFALSLLAAIMTRWIVVIFLIGPIAYSFLTLILEKNKPWNRIFKNFLLILLVLSPAILFYLGNEASLRSYVGSNMHFGSQWVVEILGNPYLKNSFSFQSMAYYFKVFEQNTIFFFMLFIAGLVFSFLKPKKSIFFLIAFFIPYLFLTFGATLKDDRYIVPIYPIIALISASVIEYIKQKKVKIVIIFLILLIGAGNFLGAVWAVGPLGMQGLQSILLPMPIGHPRRIHIATIVWPPPKDYTNAEKIVQIIENDSIKNKKHPAFLAFYNNYDINNAIYTHSNYLQRKAYRFDTLQGLVGKDRYVGFLTAVDSMDYILIKNKKNTDNSLPKENLEVIMQVNKVFDLPNGKLPPQFKEIGKVKIPLDSSEIVIYKKTKEITVNDLNAYIQLIALANPKNSEEIYAAAKKYLNTKGINYEY